MWCHSFISNRALSGVWQVPRDECIHDQLQMRMSRCQKWHMKKSTIKMEVRRGHLLKWQSLLRGNNNIIECTCSVWLMVRNKRSTFIDDFRIFSFSYWFFFIEMKIDKMRIQCVLMFISPPVRNTENAKQEKFAVFSPSRFLRWE